MAAGSSFAICIRLSNSRQESPASTRIRVRLLDTSVLFPLEPEASTVILIMRKAYASWLLILGRLRLRGATRGTPGSTAFPLWVHHPENPGSSKGTGFADSI